MRQAVGMGRSGLLARPQPMHVRLPPTRGALCAVKATPRWKRQVPRDPVEVRREIGSRDIDMTGGVGDYYIPEEDQPVGVRVARSFGARVAAWYSQQDGKQVLYGGVIIAVSLVGGFILVDLIDLLPVAPALLRFVGLFVTGWGLWRYIALEDGPNSLLDDIVALKDEITQPFAKRK